MELPPLFRERAEFSEAKLAEFREAVSQGVPELAGFPQLCIYTTGSFGRREAGRHSDIDLFFVTEGDPGCIPKLKKTLIDADLIRVGKRLGYPEFSRDGLYLKPHSIRSLSEKIGHQDEDAENSFTARLLLLLESAPIYNEGVYHRAIGACVGQYYRDYAKHISDFNPIFLANDIMRYWKTLCLNYEYARVNIKDEDKPKHWLNNYKLKMSRMMICYSMLCCLWDRGEADSPDKFTRLVGMTPIQRLAHIAAKHELTDLFGQLAAEYEWFLANTDREKLSARQWIADNKNDVRRRDATFGNVIYALLQQVATKTGQDLRYLVV